MRTSRTAGGGYSGTPLAKKIGVKAGQRVRLVHRPEGWEIPGLPEGCAVSGGDGSDGGEGGDGGEGSAGVDVAVVFHRSLGELVAEAPALVGGLDDHAMLWIAWPRKAAGHRSDITENALREIFLPLGVVDVKVAALGEDWSGLKFVRRKELRTT
ncbi:DUF3052 family protein [Streptomyces olivochromogenes]|uniref:DUF3052 domain-containing protein n=1 Tax=Streptomyces olivochromogenes TaxID=1963 RepID=A0A250VGI7_STROL|nr:DUF3052 family protein [Streptomyces olivochromogenes]KUN44306.1 hypothetical protein AQJ27_26240 [Streptomyces olivochromogenes]GAX53186.1 hypothetical protein SO3561_04713 [Streptomyces olivochromogenes]